MIWHCPLERPETRAKLGCLHTAYWIFGGNVMVEINFPSSKQLEKTNDPRH